MIFNLHKNLKKTLKNLNFMDNDIHLQNKRKEHANDAKKNIIWDKICPKCKNFIYGNTDFCTCGYSVIREKTVKLWGLIIFTWFFIITFIFFIFNSFSQLNSIVYKKLERKDSGFYSLSPVSVQIITSLRDSKYKNYIQTIYINPKAKNKLMVLIKPIYWEMLPFEEKELLKQIIMKKWNEIYKNTTSDSKLKPEVHLANFE